VMLEGTPDWLTISELTHITPLLPDFPQKMYRDDREGYERTIRESVHQQLGF